MQPVQPVQPVSQPEGADPSATETHDVPGTSEAQSAPSTAGAASPPAAPASPILPDTPTVENVIPAASVPIAETTIAPVAPPAAPVVAAPPGEELPPTYPDSLASPPSADAFVLAPVATPMPVAPVPGLPPGSFPQTADTAGASPYAPYAQQAPAVVSAEPRVASGARHRPILTAIALIVVVTIVAGLLAFLGYVERGFIGANPLAFALFSLDGLRFWLPGLALALVGGAAVLLVAGRRSSPGLPAATAWLFPFAAVFAGLLVLSVYHDRGWWFAAPIVTWVALIIGTLARTFLREPASAGHDAARTALTIISYVVAFLTLAMLYINKLRSIYSATAVAVICVLLLLQMTDGEAASLSRRFVYAIAGGLIIGQVTWVINYWSAAGWTGGAFLLAVFYLIAGLSAAQLRDRIGLFDVIEFGGVALLAIAIVSAAVLYQS